MFPFHQLIFSSDRLKSAITRLPSEKERIYTEKDFFQDFLSNLFPNVLSADSRFGKFNNGNQEQNYCCRFHFLFHNQEFSIESQFFKHYYSKSTIDFLCKISNSTFNILPPSPSTKDLPSITLLDLTNIENSFPPPETSSLSRILISLEIMRSIAADEMKEEEKIKLADCLGISEKTLFNQLNETLTK